MPNNKTNRLFKTTSAFIVNKLCWNSLGEIDLCVVLVFSFYYYFFSPNCQSDAAKLLYQQLVHYCFYLHLYLYISAFGLVSAFEFESVFLLVVIQ